MRLLSVTALVALVLTVFGCVGGATDIDRTQPGKLRKSALDV